MMELRDCQAHQVPLGSSQTAFPCRRRSVKGTARSPGRKVCLCVLAG
jgi:hypothetical protein